MERPIIRGSPRIEKIVEYRQAALPDPHDDTSLPPLILRAAKSPTSQVELVVVAILAVCVPLGWLAGVAIKSVLVDLIPQTLRSFPIAALLWSGVALGALCPALLQNACPCPLG